MPKHEEHPNNGNQELLGALQESTLGNAEELNDALERHHAGVMGMGVKREKVDVDEDSKVVDIPSPNVPKEKPIWEKYGYPDEKSFRKVYPNAGRPVKKDPRGVN